MVNWCCIESAGNVIVSPGLGTRFVVRIIRYCCGRLEEMRLLGRLVVRVRRYTETGRLL